MLIFVFCFLCCFSFLVEDRPSISASLLIREDLVLIGLISSFLFSTGVLHLISYKVLNYYLYATLKRLYLLRVIIGVLM